MSAPSTAASICAAVLCCAASLHAQQLFAQALTQFPADTRHIEYENLIALRTQPNFAGLQNRFFAKPLTELEDAFALAGAAADDIDEIVSASRDPHPNGSNTYGLISGRIRLNRKALVKARIDQTVVYCLPTEKSGLCFITQDEVSTIFGSFSRLYSILQVTQGLQPRLGSERVIASLLNGAASNQSIRGIDDGAQLGESVGTLLPSSLANFANWPQLFSTVQSFAYSVNVGRIATIQIDAVCKDEAAATTLHQVLSTFAGIQTEVSPLSMIKNMSVAHVDSHLTLSFDSPVPAK